MIVLRKQTKIKVASLELSMSYAAAHVVGHSRPHPAVDIAPKPETQQSQFAKERQQKHRLVTFYASSDPCASIN
jgi:hypothetical protein